MHSVAHVLTYSHASALTDALADPLVYSLHPMLTICDCSVLCRYDEFSRCITCGVDTNIRKCTGCSKVLLSLHFKSLNTILHCLYVRYVLCDVMRNFHLKVAVSNSPTKQMMLGTSVKLPQRLLSTHFTVRSWWGGGGSLQCAYLHSHQNM